MAELRRGHADLDMVQAENERSMIDLDCEHKGLPRFHAQNEISPLPKEKM